MHQQQREKMFLHKTDARTPAQQAIRSRGMAPGGFVAGLIAALATVLLYLLADVLWIAGMIITIMGFILGSWHGVKSVWLARRL